MGTYFKAPLCHGSFCGVQTCGWEITVDDLLRKCRASALLFKDEGMTRLLFEIRKTNESVKHYLLENYVNECKVMHALAFLQWRLYFS